MLLSLWFDESCLEAYISGWRDLSSIVPRSFTPPTSLSASHFSSLGFYKRAGGKKQIPKRTSFSLYEAKVSSLRGINLMRDTETAADTILHDQMKVFTTFREDLFR